MVICISAGYSFSEDLSFKLSRENLFSWIETKKRSYIATATRNVVLELGFDARSGIRQSEHQTSLLQSPSNDIVSTKIYDKRDDFDFEIVNFPFLDGGVPPSTSYGVYVSQLIRFARAPSYVADFNTRNKL